MICIEMLVTHGNKCTYAAERWDMTENGNLCLSIRGTRTHHLNENVKINASVEFVFDIISFCRPNHFTN